MINALVVAVLVSAFVVEYLIRERGLLHHYAILIPEMLSAIAMVVVVARLMAGVRIQIDGRYTLFFVVLLVTMVSGFVLQDVPTGAMLAGLRAHLKFVPFFLLPLVFRFSLGHIRVLLFVVFALLLIQAPVAVHQRFFEYAHRMDTGDVVRGMATTSSALSLLMMCGIATVISLYLRGRLRLPIVIVMLGTLVLPATLNETKATLLLLPMAVVAPALFMPKGSRSGKKLLPIIVLGSIAMVAFVSVYDYLAQYNRTEKSLGEFIGETNFTRYLYSGAASQGANYIGRFDSLEFALKGISRDPLTTAFGLGAGNVSTSFISQFDGEYAAYYDRYGVGMTQVTNLLWQIGFVGLASYLFLYFCVFSDARVLVRDASEQSLLGQIWATVMIIMSFALIYKSVYEMNEIGYPFWFFSGVVAARAVEIRRAARVARQRTIAATARSYDMPSGTAGARS